MYLVGAAVGAVVGLFLVSRLVLWALRKARFAGRGAILIAHAASLMLALTVGSFAFADGGGVPFVLVAAVYVAATAALLAADMVTYKRSWWRRPVYQVI